MSASVRIIKDEVRPFINKLIRNLENPEPALRRIGILEKSQTQLRFRRQIDPTGKPWQPLSPITIAAKNSAVILKKTGRLQGSIEFQVINNKVFVGTNVRYGRVHQEGNSVPQRPFLGVNQKTADNVITVFEKFLGF